MKLKGVTGSEKLKVLKIRLQLNVIIRREPKKKLRSPKFSSSPAILIITQYMNMETSHNG